MPCGRVRAEEQGRKEGVDAKEKDEEKELTP